MDVKLSYQSVIGGKETNQDSILIERADTPEGEIIFAVVCDGMGGLAKGELASAEVIRACDRWFGSSFPALLKSGFSVQRLNAEWNALIQQENRKLVLFGEKGGFELGTTLAALLVMDGHYYIANVGDSRVYAVSDRDISILTRDHTLVMNEAEQGLITYEEMETDSRGKYLLECIGVADKVNPDFYEGVVETPLTFFLCSDGCRHLISNKEFFQLLRPQAIESEECMTENLQWIVQENLNRGEMDNISGIVLRIG